MSKPFSYVRPAASTFLDLDADASAVVVEDVSIAGAIREGARLELKRLGHTGAYAWCDELIAKAKKHKGCPGIERMAHAVKLELMRKDLAQSGA